MAGYHISEIKKGIFGHLSKIQEELDELKDAEMQGVRILMLVELSDLVGAIEQYLKIHLPGYTLHDLQEMAALTRKAFKEGRR